MRKPKKQQKPLNDLSRSLTPFDPNQTLNAVVEMGKRSWLVSGIIPGVERQPLKKLAADEQELLKLLERWRAEAEKAGHKITRIAVAFETGRDGFWLARWLRARGIEAHVIHAASVAVSREHRRAKTDRLDTEQLKRAFLGRRCGDAHRFRRVGKHDQRLLGAADLDQQSNRIEIGTQRDNVLPGCLGDARIAQKPIAWRQRLVVVLGHTRAVTGLLGELEGRLERIHEQSHQRIEPRQLSATAMPS